MSLEYLQWLTDTVTPWLPLLTLFSIVMALASVVALPLFLRHIPEDYFSANTPSHPYRNSHPVIGTLLVISRNLLALLLLAAGIAMLVLPGQGLLTILIALFCSSFPGKYRLERAIIRRPSVFRAANWVRKKYRKAPLTHPDSLTKEHQ